MRKYALSFYIFFTSVLFLVRVIIFAFSLGGIEMDSGWHLGVARNLAQRGIYASYTNTVTNEGEGDYPSIHSRFSVQDKEGFVYFPAAISAGPGYVVPQAIIMKVFGYDWWQFRLWPLFTFLGMLLLLFYFTYKLGGFLALVLIQLWLWIFTQIYIPMSYEAYGEHIALFYLLFSFFLFIQKVKSKKTNYLIMFMSGFTLSLSVLTKFISLLAISSFATLFLYDLYLLTKKVIPKKVFIDWFFWGAGFFIPIIIFEVYRYLSIVSQFGKEGLDAVKSDIRLRFEREGSGLTKLNLEKEFIINKFLIWNKVGFKHSHFIWLALLFYPYILIKKSFNKNLSLFILIFISCLSGLFWFVIISPTGWARHAWISLLLGLILFFAFVGRLFQILITWKRFYYLFLIGLVLIIVINNAMTHAQFTINEVTVHKWETQRYIGSLQGLPTNSIFSFEDQKEVKIFFKKNISYNDRIYFLDGFLNSEISVITDKVFFPFLRYKNLREKNSQGGASYLIIGPYQKGRLALVGDKYIQEKVNLMCADVVYENPSYTLCTLR